MNLRELAYERLAPLWRKALEPYLGTSSFLRLSDTLTQEFSTEKTIYPAPEHFFRAFEETDLDQVKVVLIGQDPYHGPGQATGLSFAVPNHHHPKPPSLRNLLRELKEDLGTEPTPGHSDLTAWAQQGVLLLNTSLSVRAGEPASHAGIGWEDFTREVLSHLRTRTKGLVFLLLGNHAQGLMKGELPAPDHRMILAPHPSPLSAYRGFFGSRIYSRTNEALNELGHDPIDWTRISLK
jgi:uracil-DNA glycosylase